MPSEEEDLERLSSEEIDEAAGVAQAGLEALMQLANGDHHSRASNMSQPGTGSDGGLESIGDAQGASEAQRSPDSHAQPEAAMQVQFTVGHSAAAAAELPRSLDFVENVKMCCRQEPAGMR